MILLDPLLLPNKTVALALPRVTPISHHVSHEKTHRGLPGTRLPLHHHHLIRRHGLQQPRLEFVHRQRQTGLQDGVIAGRVQATGPRVGGGGLTGGEGGFFGGGLVMVTQFFEVYFAFAVGG